MLTPRALLRAPIRLLRRFIRARDGVSAVEFALISPLLIVLFGGVVELSGTITASNRASFVSDTIAEMASRLDHTATTSELKNFAVAAALVDPDLLHYAAAANLPIEGAYKATITSVQFTPKIPTCLNNCDYNANVVFSYTMNGTARSCGTLAPAPASSQTYATLPQDVFGPGSLVVVDIEASYQPLKTVRLPTTMVFKRTSYFRPRYVSRVNSQSNCPGF